MKKYQSRKGSHLSDEQAKIFGPRIAELMADRGGKLTPIELLEDARKKESPYHDFFDWDNDSAAEKFRIHQARYLLSNIVEIVIIEKKPSLQRAFFNVTDETNPTGKVYVTVKTAIKVDSYRTELLNKIIQHLENTTTLMKLFKQIK